MTTERFNSRAVREFTAETPKDGLDPIWEIEDLPEGGYVSRAPDIRTELEITRLRSDRQGLVGELTVRCELPGARTINGLLATADIGLSSIASRRSWERVLRERGGDDIDWLGILGEFAQFVLKSERGGEPAIDLRTIPEPDRDDFEVDGFAFPRRHPSILFGDGGAAKSYTALRLAGLLAQRGASVGLFDWELAGEEHRERLGRLFPDDMPLIEYVRCDRPLTAEADRLRRIVCEKALDFAVYDSVAFACDGPPESSEVAARYFRDVRRIGIGSLHIAHVTKREDGGHRPFGSAFWHNGARTTWFARAERAGDQKTLKIVYINRKANLGAIRSSLGFTVTFAGNRTTFEPCDASSSGGKRPPTVELMQRALEEGPLSVGEICERIGAIPDTVQTTARRHKSLFARLDDGKLALHQSDA